MLPPVWKQRLARVYRRLRPEAETRRRTRYYIFDLIGRVAEAEADAAAGQQEERPMTVPLKKTTLGVLLALLLAIPALAGENDSKTTPPAASQPQLQQQLTEQQQRILELERLLKQQGLLLEALRQQLAAMQLQPAPMPTSASAAAPAFSFPVKTRGC